MKKQVLLIGGGGTLGSYTAEELLCLGHKVDVICLEDKKTDNENLTYIRERADLEFLKNFLKDKKYDGIVNFLHYQDEASYAPYHELLTKKCDHLIFLSSYRIYADLEHPITENAPKLLDITKDSEFLATEKYALSKAKCERYLNNNSLKKNWTVVRPVISFSERRFDLVTHSNREVIEAAEKGEALTLPSECKNLRAALTWAGNSGKMIAHLLFKEGVMGEAYTVADGENLTWGEIADIYSEVFGTQFLWVDTETYLLDMEKQGKEKWILLYDRLYDRFIDNSKILKATNLKKEDFKSIKEGLEIEYAKIKK